MKIIFMGTPHFAVPSLDILVKNGYDVVAVITAVDKPAGRGKKLHQSAVKKYALANNLKVLQPKNLKSRKFQAGLKALKAEVQVVVAFRMLPEGVWAMPPKGTFNLHSSLLPQYRGAAPINWAVINGESETGVSTFFIDKQIDTGEMIYTDRIPIGENDTAGQVHDQLMELGAKLVLKTVQAIEKGENPSIPQPDLAPDEIKHAPKIFKETCQINFDQNTAQVHNFIRGLSPYPTAFTTWQNKTVKIFETRKVLAKHTHEAGTWHSDGKTYLHIATPDGFISVLSLQMQGKKRSDVKAFLNGYGRFFG